MTGTSICRGHPNPLAAQRFRAAWVGPAFLCAAFLGAALAGCSHDNRDILEFLQAHEHQVSAIEYTVQVPDEVEISAPSVEEIDRARRRIQPNGKVTLDLVGEVKVAGMTAKEIARKLETLLSKYYVDPEVAVRVVGYNSRKYYVTLGETGETVAFPYTGRDTLLDVMSRAQLSFLSWKSQVRVIRPSHDPSKRKEIYVNVDRMLKSGDLSANVLIEPEDIIDIPPTPLAWVGLRIREVLWPVSPALDAYTTPAAVMAAQDVYEDENNSNRSLSVGRVSVRR